MSPFLCVLHTIWPFWHCSMVRGSEQPPYRSLHLSAQHMRPRLWDPTCALLPCSIYRLQLRLRVQSLNRQMGDVETSFVMPCPPLPLPALLLPIPFPGCDWVCHLSHTGLPSASRSFTAQCHMAAELCRKLLPMCHSLEDEAAL